MPPCLKELDHLRVSAKQLLSQHNQPGHGACSNENVACLLDLFLIKETGIAPRQIPLRNI